MVIADLEIHSRYARACSKEITPVSLHAWAKRKGVNLLAAGDITHPLWRWEVRRSVIEKEPGFFVLKEAIHDHGAPRFVLGGEVSLMFRMHEWAGTDLEGRSKGRRVHLIFLAPSFEAVERLVEKINPISKLASDGRPIISTSCRDFAQMCFDADPNIMIIPAHIWTPWFGLLGSKSGFDSIEEAFGEYAPRITAYETGLSADPAMCWRVPTLQNRVLLSSSDLHSLPNMMREATLFHGDISDYSYALLQEICSQPGHANYYGTLEFFPEEGKYHMDGHAACSVVLKPEETQRLKGLCPSCGKPLTVGVLHRVVELANKPKGYQTSHAGKVLSAIPLQELIADALAKRKQSQAVQRLYCDMTDKIGNEYSLLFVQNEWPDWVPQLVQASLSKMRQGEVAIEPGYDGLYGKIHVVQQRDPRINLWQTE